MLPKSPTNIPYFKYNLISQDILLENKTTKREIFLFLID